MLRLTESQPDRLCERIPDPPVNPKGGRPPAHKRTATQGTFRTPGKGVKWKSLPSESGTKSIVHRWLKTWAEQGVFERLVREAAQRVEQRGEYTFSECFPGGTFGVAKGGGEEAYDSDALDTALAGVREEMITPHR